MFQHLTYGDLPLEVVEAEAGAEGELGHVDNLDCKLLLMNTSSRTREKVLFLPIEKIMSPENMEFNESYSYQSSLASFIS